MNGSGWRVVGASVPGAHHEAAGTPCQDYHAWRVLAGEVLIAAVADGAGTAALSEVGAAVAAETALAYLERQHADGQGQARTLAAWKTGLAEAIKLARVAVLAEAVARQREARELATTLAVLVASAAGVVTGRIGDSIVVLADAAGTLSGGERTGLSEYLNVTSFLTSDDALAQVQFNLCAGRYPHLVMMSDGLQMLALKLPEGTPHRPFFAPLLQFAERRGGRADAAQELTAFLRSPRIRARADDDLTLLLACQTCAAAGKPA